VAGSNGGIIAGPVSFIRLRTAMEWGAIADS
jgi:hypothetical protein